MALTDRKVMTFDVVGTLIDFETGILDYVQGKAQAAGVTLSDRAILEAYAVAEDRQHHQTPRLPFPSMMAPMYREIAEVLGLPDSNSDAEEFRLSIPHWPAFADSIAALLLRGIAPALAGPATVVPRGADCDRSAARSALSAAVMRVSGLRRLVTALADLGVAVRCSSARRTTTVPSGASAAGAKPLSRSVAMTSEAGAWLTSTVLAMR